MKIAFIGGGTMGEAMVKCLLNRKVAEPRDMVISDVSSERREWLDREYKIRTLADNGKAIEGAELIVLAVKPQDLSQAMQDIKNLSPSQVVLSIVAGASLSSLCQGLNHRSVIRVMPNMPAQIGQGMNIWTATAEVSQEQKDMARNFLGVLGEELYVADEKYVNMATALSGSGPAYVFLFIEALTDGGVYIGLPRHVAQKLAVQTVLGSACTLQATGKHPAELRDMVTSPGGTTAEALLVLERGNLRSCMLEAVAAAYGKACSLSASFSKEGAEEKPARPSKKED
jgi:pyrroline-5-carboxylate reductase